MIYGSNPLAVVYNSSGVFARNDCAYGANKICFDMHWHDRFELIAIHSGSLNVDMGQRQAFVSSGSVVIIPPKQPHSATALNKGVRYTSVSFDLRSFYNQTAVCSSLLPLIFEGKMQFEIFTKAAEIFDLAVAISKDCNSFSEQIDVISKIYKLISLILDKCAVEMDEGPDSQNSFTKVIEYIKANYQSDITTSELCKMFGYTKPYFCRKFKESTGVSPMLYLKARRLEAACELLQKENTSIGDISSACGFNDPNYFTRCFTGHFGMSPAQYRKQSKG